MKEGRRGSVLNADAKKFLECIGWAKEGQDATTTKKVHELIETTNVSRKTFSSMLRPASNGVIARNRKAISTNAGELHMERSFIPLKKKNVLVDGVTIAFGIVAHSPLKRSEETIDGQAVARILNVSVRKRFLGNRGYLGTTRQ